ncbi:DNA-processing protein DprA [Halonatronum saccharophilum]|uniref:DNA-processing protein DprA n=1 Tax=Halonatronum saccharophilum TaxID=150060 RepID=UPI000485473C|nr:DNA-processing protein DprA [Halonatronum saccharophilum]
MEKKLYWVWLTKVKGLGPLKIRKLLDYFNDAQGVWEAYGEELTNVEGIGPSTAKNIIKSKNTFDFEDEFKLLNKNKVKVVTLSDRCYPKLLKEIYYPPPLLYYRGDIRGIDRPSLAVVGSRRCTTYGKSIAFKVAKRLVDLGVSVVSGMARGIDTAAHKGALKGGATYAILGSGLDVVYPPENYTLMNEIIDNGAVLSTFPLGTQPHGGNFPIRNRIISGLSLGTLVVEADKKSGSLITANYALDQGREVFAIPGDINKKQSIGTNHLIKSGAKLVQNIDDIREELPLFSLQIGEKRFAKGAGDTSEEGASFDDRLSVLTEDEVAVYKVLSSKPQQFEYLFNRMNFDTSRLNRVLLDLEIKGFIEQLVGRRFKIVD